MFFCRCCEPDNTVSSDAVVEQTGVFDRGVQWSTGPAPAPVDAARAGILPASARVAHDEASGQMVNGDSMAVLVSAPAERKALTEDTDRDGFDMVLNKSTPDAPLGMQLDFCDGKVLWVSDLRQGHSPVSEYNSRAPPDKQVRVGDYVVAVDGKPDLPMKQRLEVLQASTRLQLRVHRPSIFDVSVVRNGEPMGLNLLYTQVSKALVVTEVADGAVKTSGIDVQPGDRIVAVNGQEGSALDLMNQLKVPTSPLRLKISRCLH